MFTSSCRSVPATFASCGRADKRAAAERRVWLATPAPRWSQSRGGGLSRRYKSHETTMCGRRVATRLTSSRGPPYEVTRAPGRGSGDPGTARDRGIGSMMPRRRNHDRLQRRPARVMDVDIVVLGGGPGGYTAAIRAAQLGARVACVEREAELGGTCLRIGCIPTKAWATTAFALKQADETFDKLGVELAGSHLRFAKANAWKATVVKRMTQGIASLFKANGVEWVRGTGTFADANTISVDTGDEVRFRSAIIATGSTPMRPAIGGLDSARCVDSESLLAQSSVPPRLAVLGGGVIGCEFASIFQRFGSKVTIIEVLPSLIPQEDAEASKELARSFRRRGVELHLETRCTRVEDNGAQLTVHFGERETTDADLMLVAVGRRPVVQDLGLENIGVRFDRTTGIIADKHRRTTLPHVYAVGDCAGFWQLAHTAYREGEVAATNACGQESTIGRPAVPRPIY